MGQTKSGNSTARVDYEFSDWLPHTAKDADNLPMISPSCWTNWNKPFGLASARMKHRTQFRPVDLFARHCVTYGLGTENENLPPHLS